ncbi:MAG: TetR/AcrR family transcriptional regulator [Planctomycetes bacterium]|nr:TetR/AcrR family transcriptional regulator [Planctomycetota bacterium]MCB9888717.1 TetR/AcrR family transcriptional regulator [Planctomycetota bacterium]
MARPKDEDLRGRVLAVASVEFAARGFAATTVAAVGAAAGVTKGGVYFHFRGKEELFFAVVEHWREAHRRLLQPVAGASLRGFLVEYLRFHFRHPEAAGVLRVLASEFRGHFTAQVREDQGATARAVRLRIRELLSQGALERSLFATDPALAAFVLGAAVEGVVSLADTAPRDVEPFRHPESIVDFLLAPYETAPPVPSLDQRRPDPPQGVDFLPPL